MIWMAMIGLGLLAGYAIFDSDDDSDNTPDRVDTEEPELPDGSFLGTTGDDAFLGNEDDNTLLGRNGNDAFSGQGGDDRIFGDGGMDTVLGANGNDSVFGGNGEDFVVGGTGDDLLRGGRDDDILIDSLGKDELNGDLGNDLIVSSGFLSDDAADALVANPEPENGVQDLLRQLEIDMSEDLDPLGDSVNGGVGNDTMIFGVDDTVTGGTGQDTFVTASWLEGQAPATITDFQPGEDQLVYAYDAAEGSAPTLTVEDAANDAGGSDAIVYANGVEVLRVLNQGGFFDPSLDVRLLRFGTAATG